MDVAPKSARRAGLLLVAAGALAGLCAGAACGRSERAPDAVLRGFLSASARGDMEAAVAYLSGETRRALEARVARAREAAGITDDRPLSAALVEHFQSRLTRGAADVKVVENAGGRAVVVVVDHRDREERFDLIEEDGVWRVVLPLGAGGEG